MGQCQEIFDPVFSLIHSIWGPYVQVKAICYINSISPRYSIRKFDFYVSAVKASPGKLKFFFSRIFDFLNMDFLTK